MSEIKWNGDPEMPYEITKSMAESVGKQPNGATIKVLAEIDAETNVYAKEIWNAAISECLKVNAKLGGSTEVDEKMRRLKNE